MYTRVIFHSSEFIYHLLIYTEKPIVKSLLVHSSLVLNIEGEYHSYKSTAYFSLSLLQEKLEEFPKEDE